MGKDASAIRQEIEETRARMGDTVEALAYKTDVPARVKDSVNERVDSVRETIGDVVDNVKTAVAGAADSVRANSTRDGGVAARTRDQVGRTVNTVNESLGDLGDRLQDVDVAGKTRRAVGAVQENPIGLALAALAVGFLTGSLLPVSDAERTRLRPLSDKIVDEAQAATDDLVQAGKAIVNETAAAALSSAQTHGHEVVDAAKTRADQS